MVGAKREVYGDRVESDELLHKLDEIGLPFLDVRVDGRDHAGISLSSGEFELLRSLTAIQRLRSADLT